MLKALICLILQLDYMIVNSILKNNGEKIISYKYKKIVLENIKQSQGIIKTSSINHFSFIAGKNFNPMIIEYWTWHNF